jgi:ABC-type Zn uptake system ZnuABC Zn-binding protein ZnuA
MHERVLQVALGLLVALLGFLLVGCGGTKAAGAATPSGSTGAQGPPPKVLAVETFLADIAQNVAGDRLKIDSLMPVGVDPHSFEPTPGDAAKVADADVLVVNGAGLEDSLQKLLKDARPGRRVVEASAGLASRSSREGEQGGGAGAGASGAGQADPHFWLDPNLVVTYVANIRDGLSKADPAGASAYARNAAAYTARLRDLDAWIVQQVSRIPEDRRLLVTNHESLGYYADRYGFRIVGTIVPSVGTGVSPSAQQLARLIDTIKQTQARAIFLEVGVNADLARQVAAETGAAVVTDLLTHSLTGPTGSAPTYIDMMKADTTAIVGALS